MAVPPAPPQTYVGQAMFVLALSVIISREWAEVENLSLLQYAGLKLKLGVLLEDWEVKSVLAKLCSPHYLVYMHQIRARASYQARHPSLPPLLPYLLISPHLLPGAPPLPSAH